MNTLERTKLEAQKQSGAAEDIAKLDPQVGRFATALSELMQLQALQTIASHKDPQAFPVKPRQVRVKDGKRDYNNTGLTVDKWLKAMPAEKRQKLLADFELGAHLTPELKAAMQQMQIDLKSPVPVLEQVDLKSRFNSFDADFIKKVASARKFDDVAGDSNVGGAAGATVASRGVVNTALKFRLHKVTCDDETTSSEWAAKDHIRLGGAAIDDRAKTTEIAAFTVNDDFKDGAAHTYNPPKVLKTFPLSGAFPKTFIVTIALAEIDGGTFSTFLYDLVNSIEDEVDAVITAAGVAAGAVIGGSLGGPIGALVGAVGTVLASEVVDLISHIKDDEVWKPQSRTIELKSASGTFAGSLASPVNTLTFTGFNGKYTVSHSWEFDR